MQATFIIEGPDNSGKSTLATALAERLNMASIHQVRPASAKDFFYYWLAEHKFVNTIFDRSMALSQQIYDKITGRDQVIHADELDLFIKSTVDNIPMIICLPPPEIVLNASADREEMAGVADNRAELYELYSEFAQAQIGNKNVVVFDYTIHTVEEAVEWLRQFN